LEGELGESYAAVAAPAPMTLAHLMVFVPDLDRARGFYSGVLGFPVTGEGPDHLAFDAGGTPLLAFRGDRPTTVGDYSRESRAVFVFRVPSVQAAMAELKAAGVPLLHDTPGEGPTGRYAAFVDPFGIVHEVLEGWPPAAETA